MKTINNWDDLTVKIVIWALTYELITIVLIEQIFLITKTKNYFWNFNLSFIIISIVASEKN